MKDCTGWIVFRAFLQVQQEIIAIKLGYPEEMQAQWNVGASYSFEYAAILFKQHGF
jgi:hypothetical protein